VRLDRSISDEDLRHLKDGVQLEDGIAKPTAVQSIPKTKRTELLIALHEGKNREVRRMIEELGYEVKRLERISFAGITTEGLARGKWRKLTAKEVEHLKRIAGLPT
jgi:23S rRNA pseudouridine2605 synthase